MADPKDLLEEATTRAVLTAGRDAAKRAARDLLESDEERAARAAGEAQVSKKRRWKIIAVAVLALFVLIGVVGMLVSYWQWFLLLGLAGIGGLFGYWQLRKRWAARRGARAARIEVVPEKEAKSTTREQKAPRQAEADARDVLAEAEATEQAVEDELEALKARINRRG